MTDGIDNDRAQRDRLVKFAFGVGALVCVLTGLVLYLYSEALGFDQETAELVAIAFLIAGCGDYILLHFWDRIMRNRS